MDKFTLKQWRGIREMSQKDISERLGVHINTYQNWEKEPGKIKVEQAQRLAEVFQTPIDAIDFTTGCP